LFGSKEWKERGGIFMEGRVKFVFDLKEGMKGRERDFNYKYVWSTRGGEEF
jgi:hypothetical protein